MLNQQINKLRQGIGRLIDRYTERVRAVLNLAWRLILGGVFVSQL